MSRRGAGGSRRVAAVVVAGIVMVAGVVSAVVATGAFSKPGGPSGWDPRIASIVRFVEKDRGLTFRHPVPAEFLSTSAFEAEVAKGDSGSGGPSDAEELGQLRALGLAHGNPDLGSLETEADQSSTVGFYDTSTKKLYVEGTSMTPYVRVTVAHELIHALQDQRLDLAALDDRPDDQQTAISALVEGDAAVVEQDYRSTFSAAEEMAYKSEESAIDENTGPADLPEFLSDQGRFPYDFGPTFVDALVDEGGNQAVDRAFADPPTAEAQIADPARYIAGVRPAPVAAPALPAGARRLEDPAMFGQVSLAEVLGTRLGYPAWATVQGWKGDSSVVYSEGGRTCVAIEVEVATAGDASSLTRAGSQWAAALPAGAGARVDTGPGADTVDFRSCDPGPDAPAVTTASPAGPGVYDILAARAGLIDDLLNTDYPSPGTAQCITDGTITALGVTTAVAYEDGDQAAPSDTTVHVVEHRAAPACSSH